MNVAIPNKDQDNECHRGDDSQGTVWTGGVGRLISENAYAAATLLFGISVACILVYGSWYRESQLISDYETELELLQRRYQKVFAEADTTSSQLFPLGSEIDLRMRRIGNQSGELGDAYATKQLNFLRRHSHRLDRLVRHESRSGDEDSFEEVRSSIEKYYDRIESLANTIHESKLPLRHRATLLLTESAIVSGQLNLAQLEEQHRDLSEIIHRFDFGLETSNEELNFSEKADRQQTLRRATTLIAWLWIEKSWQSAPRVNPLMPTQSSIEAGLAGLVELQQTISSLFIHDDDSDGLQVYLRMAQLLMQLNSAVATSTETTLDIETAYEQASIQNALLEESDCIADLLPSILGACFRSDWNGIRMTLASLDQTTSPLGPRDVSALRRLVSRTICRLVAARRLEVLSGDAAASLASGLGLAIELDGGSPEVSSLIWELSLLCSGWGSAWLDAGSQTRLGFAKESMLANPSQPAFLVTSVIAGGIDRNDARLYESLETGRMLQAQVPIRARLWLFGDSGPPTQETPAQRQPTQWRIGKPAMWCHLLEDRLAKANRGTSLDFETSLSGYIELSLAAWQVVVGDIESGRSNLRSAKETLGTNPVISEIESAYPPVSN